MSSSSLYVMDKNFNGFEIKEYRNSWWFSPVIWDVLLDKYLHDKIQTPFGYKKSLITGGNELNIELNETINHCEDTADRICWEISNQQVFFSKDKVIIAQSIKDFARNNTSYHINSEEGISVLSFEHILERFDKTSDDILQIDENKYPFFVFKNTSVDDNVERWFEKYDEENDDYKESTLKEIDEYVTEFVHIEDGKIKGFVSNLDFFKVGR